MWGLYIEEYSPTVMCAVRTKEVERNFENMWGMYMEEDSPAVVCAVRTTEVKRNLDNMRTL